jgi:hypothetical protein
MVVDKSSGRVRGGRDQFNWDTIEDKYRENYLGHSLKAPRGKWQEGKDLIWYTKKKPGSADDVVDDKQLKLQQEIAMVQQKEAELLLAAQAKPAPSTMDMFKKFVLLSSEEQQKVNKQVIRYDTTTRAERREENSKEKDKRYRRRSVSRSKSPSKRSSKQYSYRSRHRSRSYDDKYPRRSYDK